MRGLGDSSRKFSILIFLIAWLTINTGYVSAWSNSSFDRCMNVTISNAGSSTLTDFPAYVNLSHDSDMLSDFTDIRFYGAGCGDSGSEFDFEIEDYVASDRADVWVRIPSLPGSGTTISVYYKNNTAVGSGENATGVWDSNYVLVHHLEETDIDGGSGDIKDSTSSNNDGTTNGMNTNDQVAGKVDGSFDFDGSDDYVNCGNDNSLDLTSNITLETWIKVPQNWNPADQEYHNILAKNSLFISGYGLDVYEKDSDSSVKVEFWIRTSGRETATKIVDTSWAVNSWQYVAGVFNGTDLILYFNGTQVDIDSASGNPGSNTENFYIASANLSAPTDEEYKGKLDGVRVSDIGRSREWINQTYQMIGNQNNLVTFDEEDWRSYTIDSCSVLNRPDVTYTLGQDILNSASTACINVSADNVILDCQGNIIDGVYAGDTYGVYIDNRSNVTIRNCTLTDWWFGVYMISADNSTVSHGNFTGNQDGVEMVDSESNSISHSFFDNVNEGMNLNQSSYNLIDSCSIESGNRGISFYQSSNENTFSGNDLQSFSDYGVYVYQSYDNFFRDSNISTACTNVYHFASCDTTFLNVTMDEDEISVDAGAVYVNWYLDVRIVNEDSVPIGQANVTVKDAFNTTLFSELTGGSSGYIATQNVTGFHQNFSGKFSYNNHTINVTRFGFLPNESSVNVTGNHMETVQLSDIASPQVTVETYDQGLSEKYMFRPGSRVRIRAYVNYTLGGDYISNATLTLINNRGAVILDGVMMGNVSSTSSGSVHEYNYTIPDDAQGLWTVNVTAKSAFGSEGRGQKKIAAVPVTLQVKIVLNSTSDSIYIPGTGETSFSGLETENYYSPGHYYVASYAGNALKSVVSASKSPLYVATEKGTGTYSIGTGQRYANSVVFAVFSQGNWRDVNNRMGLVEDGTFLANPEPSFRYGLGNVFSFKLLLDYGSIDISNSTKIQRGSSRLLVQKERSYGNMATISIRRI